MCSVLSFVLRVSLLICSQCLMSLVVDEVERNETKKRAKKKVGTLNVSWKIRQL